METVTNAFQAFDEFLGRSMTVRTVVIILFAIAGAWLLSKLVTKLTVGVVQLISNSADKTENEERFIRWRRIETYLSVVLAFVRVFIVAVAAYIALQLIIPGGNILPATIGISTFFVVIAGATIGPLLRDFTSGLTMILGKWFSVGDFVRLEPFGDVAGVVERVTLRSTRIRNINGEIIMVHNQNIGGVRVTPRGVRTLALDVFVRDVKTAEAVIKEVIATLSVGPTMLAEPMHITRKEKVVDSLWRITVVAKTAPSREWLIEEYIREAIQSIDKDKKAKDRLIIYGPLVHYADQTAEKRFSRAMRSVSTLDKK